MSPAEQETDSFETLEDCIQRAVQLVTRLKQERDRAVEESADMVERIRQERDAASEQSAHIAAQLRQERDAALEESARLTQLCEQSEAAGAESAQSVARLRQERDAALEEAAQARGESSRLAAEIQALQADRKQVRVRIEKLLGQIDQLSGS